MELENDKSWGEKNSIFRSSEQNINNFQKQNGGNINEQSSNFERKYLRQL